MLQAVGIGRRDSGNDWLFRHINVTLHPGDRRSLVGPTGSGKTLLLRALALLDPVDEGAILWHGEPVAGNEVPRYRSRVIYLHQRAALFDGTVEDNLQLVFELQAHRGRDFDRQRIVRRLETLGRSESFLHRRQSELSGGEQQIVALLRAVQLDPHVLLLDEPTASLDAASKSTVESLVDAWYRADPSHRCLIWVTHDAKQAERVGDSIWHLRAGRLEEDVSR